MNFNQILHNSYYEKRKFLQQNPNYYYKTLNNNFLLPKQTNLQQEVTNKQKYWKRKCKKRSKKVIKTVNLETVVTKSGEWSEDDAIKAMEIEEEINRMKRTQYILRFPDPVIDKNIIQGFSPDGIVGIRVQQPITPRFVFIQLNPDMDPESLKQEITKIKFGNDFLKLEKRHKTIEENLKPEDIDPFTIFLGNIHPSISIQTIKEKVPKAQKVHVGFAKRKFGRYAFVKFRLAADAREAFLMLNQMRENDAGIDMVVRFRRLRGHISMNCKAEQQEKAVKCEKVDNFDSSVRKISNNLIKNEVFDWEMLREMHKNRPKHLLPVLNLITIPKNAKNCDENNLNDIFEQIDSNFPLIDDLDFC